MQKVKEQHRSCWQGLEPLESRLLLANDLGVAIGALPTDLPTGYVLPLQVTVTNNDPTRVTGTATLTVTFDDGVNPTVTLATRVTTFSLLAGGRLNLVIPSKIPIGAVIGTDTLTVTTVAGALTADTPTAAPNVTWDFGNIPGLGNVACTAVDPASGNTGVFSIAGPGRGSLTDPNTIWDMDLAGTTRASRVTVGGAVGLEAITAATMVGSVSAPLADFTAAPGFEGSSAMTFSGGLLSLTMHDSTALALPGHIVTIDKGDFVSDAVAIKFNTINDLDLASQMPISCFTAASYHVSTGTPEIFTAAYLGSVKITGDFTGVSGGTAFAQFDVQAANPASGLAIGSVWVGGNMDSSEVFANYGNIGPVHIGGSMSHDAEVHATYGSIGAVWVGGGMDTASIIDAEYGNIASVRVGGDVDNDSLIQVNHHGNMGAVWIGGNLDNGSQVHIGDSGNIASVTIKGNLDNGAVVGTDNLGNVGPVMVYGNVDNGAQAFTGQQGNITSVWIAGNLDNSAMVDVANGGNIGAVWIIGNLDNSAQVSTNAGKIGSVHVGGNLDNSAAVFANFGAVGPVWIGGNLDNSAQVDTNFGAIASVWVGGNLDNSAEVFSNSGTIGNVHVGKSLDHDGRVTSNGGSVGIGNVWVGRNFSNGATVHSTGAAIKSVTVLGDSLWTAGNSNQVYAFTTIGSISIGGQSMNADFEAGNSIGWLHVGGVMQDGMVNVFKGGNIGLVTVGELDGTTVQAGVNAPPLVGTRADFFTQNSSIGSLVIYGVRTAGVVHYMENLSQILAWNIGSVLFYRPSIGGSGTIEFHVGRVVNQPGGVAVAQVA